MKKVFTIIALIFLSATAFSQNIQLAPMRLTLSGDVVSGATFDTVVNTTAHYLYANPIKTYKDAVTIVATVTEINDTTAAAITLEVSIDGINWAPYYGSRDSVYTFSPADAAGAQSYRWNLYAWADAYVRVKCVGVATPNFIFTAKSIAYSKNN